MKHSQALAYLRSSVNNFLPDSLKDISLQVVENIDFQLYPASINKHHTYIGGLLIHTAEVMRNAISLMSSNKCLQMDILIPSVIFHDYGKIYDYKVVSTCEYDHIKKKYSKGYFKSDNAGKFWAYDVHRSLVRHPSRSYSEWMNMSTGVSVSTEIQLDVSHCILSHHRRIEWQSPVEPQTAEAWVLHMSDSLSSKWGEMSKKPPLLVD